LLCLCYPVISSNEAIAHKGSFSNLLGENADYAEDMSCELNIREDMPPVFIWHTFEDRSVDCRNSLVMAQQLKAKDIPFELHLFPDGKHGSDLAVDIEGTCQWFSLFANWLKRNRFCI
jgi:dipeptidyl aminopeptidase/acylaminoacyl peptidase